MHRLGSEEYATRFSVTQSREAERTDNRVNREWTAFACRICDELSRGEARRMHASGSESPS